MSSTFGGLRASSITIHQDATENAGHAAMRKTKREDVHAKAPANKRAALGTITNMTRIQPSRAVKQNTVVDCFGVENGPKCAPFRIYEDENLPPAVNVASSKASNDLDMEAFSEAHKLDLHSQLTAVRPPLCALPVAPCAEDILVEDSPFSQADSPMLLDTTLDECRSNKSVLSERTAVINTVPEYAADIYRYLREAELRNRARVGYMRKQPDVTASMRSILVDWLVEVCDEYRLHRETLCLSVSYIDRFLSQMSVLRSKLQLVGAAAMFLAAKYEEIYPPEVNEFVYITDDTYTKKQVLRMEHLILKVLSFDIAVPTANCFCEKFLNDIGADEQTTSLAMYLIELSLVEADPFLKYLPSVTAAAAICLANHTLHRDLMSESLCHSSGYSLVDLDECIHDLYQAQCKAPDHPQQAVYEKYKKDSFHQVSTLVAPSPPPHRVAPL